MKKLFLFILFPVFLTSFGEINLKYTINKMHLAFNAQSIYPIITNPLIIFSIFCIILGGMLWLIGMSKFELSFMYPFLTLNYILIILGSVWLLGETVNLHTIFSIIFIVTGLILISRSKYSAAEGEE